MSSSSPRPEGLQQEETNVYLPTRLCLGGAGTQAQLSCGRGSCCEWPSVPGLRVHGECGKSPGPGRGVCLEGLCPMCCTNLTGTRRTVVQWFCVLFTHNFTHLRFGTLFGGMSCLPQTCLLPMETPSLPFTPKALTFILCAFWLINHQGVIARVAFTFVNLV